MQRIARLACLVLGLCSLASFVYGQFPGGGGRRGGGGMSRPRPQETKVKPKTSQAESATAILGRFIGSRAGDFSFELIPSENGHDVYEVTALNGQVRIKGSTGVAMARGAYDYLKNRCGVLDTWDGVQVKLPARFPDQLLEHVVCPNQFRHYFNVCTFGYTTAFWDWKRWRQEIDWMALHGINMPLAMNGQERVWEDVWKDYGIDEKAIRSFFSGPAFLPWHRMGNINSHGGPLPQDWIDRQASLQTQILEAEREIGMTPVTPAFSGFFPPVFAEKRPELKITKSTAWAGFDSTLLLDPRDPLFPDIQRRFIKAYTKRFGTDHLYLADLYNEMEPRIEGPNKNEELTAIGAQTYKSIHDADPEATWVMQGWLFRNDTSFWHAPEVGAFLEGIPDDKIILLDLQAEAAEIWRQYPDSFGKKKYIWNTLHNFGGRTVLFGDLDLHATKALKALNDPNHGQMVGMGLTMEGIHQNAVIYELATDNMWITRPVEPDVWLQSYGAQRYGFAAPEVWSAMRDAFYRTESGVWTLATYQERPSLKVKRADNQLIQKYKKVVGLLANLPKTPLTTRDLVDATKELAAKELQNDIFEVIEAEKAGGAEAAKAPRARFLKDIFDLDALLNAVPQYRMTEWISAARNCVGSAADKDLLEKNARLQVTVWGGPELFDYAGKTWGGLVRDFYAARWNAFFDAMEKPGFNEEKTRSAIASWELGWCDRKDLRLTLGEDPKVLALRFVHQAP